MPTAFLQSETEKTLVPWLTFSLSISKLYFSYSSPTLVFPEIEISRDFLKQIRCSPSDCLLFWPVEGSWELFSQTHQLHFKTFCFKYQCPRCSPSHFTAWRWFPSMLFVLFSIILVPSAPSTVMSFFRSYTKSALTILFHMPWVTVRRIMHNWLLVKNKYLVHVSNSKNLRDFIPSPFLLPHSINKLPISPNLDGFSYAYGVVFPYPVSVHESLIPLRNNAKELGPWSISNPLPMIVSKCVDCPLIL